MITVNTVDRLAETIYKSQTSSTMAFASLPAETREMYRRMAVAVVTEWEKIGAGEQAAEDIQPINRRNIQTKAELYSRDGRWQMILHLPKWLLDGLSDEMRGLAFHRIGAGGADGDRQWIVLGLGPDNASKETADLHDGLDVPCRIWGKDRTWRMELKPPAWLIAEIDAMQTQGFTWDWPARGTKEPPATLRYTLEYRAAQID